MNQDTFARRLILAMDRRDMKQVDCLRAAAAAGVKLGKGQMSQYVSGKAVPRKNIAGFLAELLGVPVEWLYGSLPLEAAPAVPAARSTPVPGNEPNEPKKDSVPGTSEPVMPPVFHKSLFSENSPAYPDAEGEITMKSFKKSAKLDNVLYDVRGPVVEEATRMEENGIHVLKLNIGNPFPISF